ncbi:hypothetical protein ACLBXM_22415 [Xanthobacteraceae bacterium A53D]
MGFHVTHRLGHTGHMAPSDFPALLRELADAPDDTEHASVAVTHESAWCLAAQRDGRLILENLEDDDDGPRHMTHVPPERIIALWVKLAAGDIAAVAAEPWQPGY